MTSNPSDGRVRTDPTEEFIGVYSHHMVCTFVNACYVCRDKTISLFQQNWFLAYILYVHGTYMNCIYLCMYTHCNIFRQKNSFFVSGKCITKHTHFTTFIFACTQGKMCLGSSQLKKKVPSQSIFWFWLILASGSLQRSSDVWHMSMVYC